MGAWMSQHAGLRKFGFLAVSVGTVFCSAASGSCILVQEQGQQGSQQEQPPPKESQPQSQQTPAPLQTSPQRKIWTNDDVISLRSPADIYQREKEAQEAAAAAAAAKEAAQAKAAKGDEQATKEAELTIKLPATVDETQRLIKAKEYQLKDQLSGVEQLTSELAQAPADQRAEMQREIDKVTADLQKIRTELKALKAHLQKLSEPGPGETPIASPLPSSQ